MKLFRRVVAALTAVTTMAWYSAFPLEQIRKNQDFFSELFTQDVLHVQAEDSEYNGFSYSLSDTGAIITGYTGDDNVLVIPDVLEDGTPVTEIGWNAFFEYTELISVTIPESVTTIGEYAFENCTSLSDVIFSEGITDIGYRAFAGTAIESITLPSTLVNAGDAFADCDKLTSFTLADGLTRLPDSIFAYCDGLTTVTLPETLKEIGSYAFYECANLTGITLPDTVTSIGNSTFYGCVSLTDIIIPASVTTIGEYAFESCTSLSDVTFSEGITEIGYRAFAGTAIKHITIPSTLEGANEPFADCNALSSFTLADKLTRLPDSIFAYCDGLTTVTLPETLSEIGSNAFYECEDLTSVTIPDTVTSIGNLAFYGCTSLTGIIIPASATTIGEYAFENCTSLSDVTLSEGITEIGYRAFAATAIEHITIPSTLEGANEPFVDCNTLSSFTLADKLTRLPDSIFAYCDGLTTVTLPETLNEIGSNAFYECENLTGVTIPASVTTIGEYTFENCTSLSDVTLSEGITEIGYRAFAGTAIEHITIPSTLEGANEPFADCNVLSSFTLADELTRLPDSIFAYCDGLTTVTLPETLNEIGSNVFYECENLTSVTIPDTVTSIGNLAFYGCTSLTGIIIPESVTTIGEYAFENSTSLSDVIFSEGITDIGYRAFAGTAIENITLPSTLVNAGDAFADCENLVYAEFAEGMTAVPDNIFCGCYELQTVYLPETVTSLGAYAFAECGALTSVIGGTEQMSFASTTFEGCTSLSDHRFTLLDPSSSLTANAALSSVGNIVNYTLRYELMDAVAKDASDYFLAIDIPEGMAIIPESISSNVIDVENVGFAENGFYVDSSKGIVKFSCRILEYGEYTIGARLEFSYNGEWWNEPIGMLDVDVPKITCSTSKTTNTFEIDVHGIAEKNSEVEIYVDDMPIFTLFANEYTGKYSTTITLPEKASGESYRIYAQSGNIISEEIEVVYETNQPAIRSVTMVYDGGNSRMDITNVFTEGASPLVYLPTAEFQFEIEADHNDRIYKMFVTSTKGKDTKYLEAFWNPEKQLWITEGLFDPENASYVPGSLNISLSLHEYIAFDENADPYKDVSVDKISQDVLDNSGYEVISENENETLLAVTISDGVNSVELNHYYGTSDEMIINDQRVTKEQIALSPFTYGYTKSPVKTTKDDVVYQCYYRDVTTKYLDSTIEVYDYMTGLESGVSLLMIAEGGNKDKLECILLNDIWEGIYDLTFADDPFDVGPADVLLDMIGSNLELAKNFSRAQTDTERNIAATIYIGRMIGTVAGVLLPPPYNWLVSFGMNIAMDIWQYQLDQYYDENGFPRLILDPSGYVYEANPSNRIQGAKLSIYYQDPQTGEAVLWNAEDYDQSSTLYSDADGRYAWDVPEGMWQVKCEMEGYETMYSEWLPVPPVQTDINFGLISYAVPEIIRSEYTEDGIVLEFSKFMDPATVTESTVILANTEDYTITPVYVNAGDTYAYAYLIAGDFSGVGMETITCGGCESYAGTALSESIVDVLVSEETTQVPIGDLNADGSIDAVDAAKILVASAAVGSGGESGLTEAQVLAADVNGDGTFDAVDAAVILCYAAAVGSGYTGTLTDFLAA